MNKIIKNINNFIIKVNNAGFVIIIGFYILFLFLFLSLVSPNNDYIIVPSYEHKTYAEYINPQITVVGERSLNDKEEIDLNYRVTASLTGRFVNGIDPRNKIEKFQMSAATTTNRMHYFTEQKGTTPISHIYTMQNKDYENVPKQIFVKLEYFDENGDLQKDTFREDIMIKLTNKNQYSRYNKVTHIEDDEEVEDVKLQIITLKIEEGYNTSIRILVNDQTKKYHVDMQSWIVTKEGETLHFAGIYNYSNEQGQTERNNPLNRTVINELNPERIYAKLIYYVDGEDPQMIQYTETFDNLPNKFSEIVDVDREDKNQNLSFGEITLIIVGSIIVLSIGFVTIKKFKKSK